MEKAVLRTFVANLTILRYTCSVRRVFAFSDSAVRGIYIFFLTFRTCFLVVVCKLGLRVMSSYIGRRHESSNTEQWTCIFLLINIFIDNIEPKELSYWENVWQIKTNRVEWGGGARMKKRKKRVFFFKISFKAAWHIFNVEVKRMFL